MIRAHIPGRPGDPEPAEPASSPIRVWLDPHAGMRTRLQEDLLAKRIVFVSGVLDDDAAARLSAQLLTLDADGTARSALSCRTCAASCPPW